MDKAQRQVLEFHEAFDLSRADKPTVGDMKLANERFRLIREELEEYVDATSTGDLIGVADAIGDMAYVVLGTAVAHGIDLEPVFEAIHESNMLKVGGYRDEHGKWRKPEGWKPPDLQKVIAEQIGEPV